MKLLFGLLLSCGFFCTAAQDTLRETLKQQMVKDWGRAKAYTQEYLDAMPAAQYQFKAVDSIRSFAEQMLHLASANVAMTTVATGIPDSAFQNVMRWMGLEKTPAMQNKDSVVHYVNASYDFVIKAVKDLDVGKLTEIVNQRTAGGPRSETRLVWLMKAFEHQTHHRGQCTIYIRLLGVRPPGEKLF